MNQINVFENDTYSKIGYNYFLTKYGISFNSKNLKSTPQLVPSNFKLNDKEIPFFSQSSSNLEYDESRILTNMDMFKQIGYSLSGICERIWPNIGEKKYNYIKKPFVDYYCDILFNSLLNTHKNLDLPLVRKSFWPDGKRFAVCLTHDVDEIKKTYQWITYPFRRIKNFDLLGLSNQVISMNNKLNGKEPFWTFDKLLDIENKYNVKSSFFFLEEDGKVKLLDKKTWRHAGRRYKFKTPKVADLMKELKMKGWDVGLHGSFYSYKDSSKLISEKKALEKVLGDSIHGTRQHNLNLDIPKTWLYHEKAGLEYDTTLGFNDCLGFRWGTCFPFKPFSIQDNRLINILEIPLVIEDLPYFRDQNRWDNCMKIIQEIEKYGGVLTLLWHHSVFNDNEFPGWGAAYEKIIGLCQEKNAWITNAKEIADWWSWRDKSNFEWIFDGSCLKIMPFPLEKRHFLNIYPPEKMSIKKIHNAKIIESNNDMISIQTNIPKNNEYIEIEFSEIDYNNEEIFKELVGS